MADPKEWLYDWLGGNVWLFKLINGIHGGTYDLFMLCITQLGSKYFFLPYLTILLIYALIALLIKKVRNKIGVQRHIIMWTGVFIVLIAGFAVNTSIIYLLKDYLSFPRPYMALPAQAVTLIEIRGSEDAYHSFPSGHVGFITLMVVGLWPVLSFHMRLFGLFVIFMVAWSRIALGVHFPADVLGAFLLSSLIVITLRAVIYNTLQRFFGWHCGGD